MFQRRWAGEKTPFPIFEEDTHVHVSPSAIGRRLRGKTDPETGVQLDYISTYADGAVGMLTNAVLMHSRTALRLLEDRSWLENPEAEVALRLLEPASLNARALQPRGTHPNRFVHSLLPDDFSTLTQTVRGCANGSMCVRMGSRALCQSALMLYYAAFDKSHRGVPWKKQTDEQGDPLRLMESMANII